MIPLFKPSCTDLEVRYVTEALRSGWWGLGPRTEELEGKFAAYVGAKYAVATNSATTALELAMTVLRRTHREDQFAICPALTFVSTGLAAKRAGYKVIFADIDADTLCLDWNDVNAKNYFIDDVIVPVWYGGHVDNVATRNDLLVVEDCAHAAGSKNAGKLGQLACWSFHAVKNLAAGDGGMITTNDESLYRRLKALRWCGIDRSTWDRDNKQPYGWDYNITESNGSKAHMNDITASLALAQLERLDSMNAMRGRLVARYLDELKATGIAWLTLPVPSGPIDIYRSSNHLFVVRVNHQLRDAFIDHMLANGVSAGVHYKPLHYYPKLFGYKHSLPVTDHVWRTLVTLPLYPDMTEKEQDTVIAAVKSFKGK